MKHSPISDATQQAPLVTVKPRLLRVDDAAEYMGLGRTSIYAEIRAKRLAIVKIGKATRLELTELDRWLDNLTSQTAS